MVTLLLSVGLAQITIAGYSNGGGSGSFSSLSVGSTSISGGTSPYLLYNNSGTLGNESLASLLTSPPAIGGTTPAAGAFSTLKATSVSSDLVPTTASTNELGSPSAHWQYVQADNINLWANGNGLTLSLNNSIASSYNLVFPAIQGTSGQTIIDDGSGNLSFGGLASLSGTLAIGNGGTGQTTANAALNALLPTQTGNNGKVLETNGTNTAWQSVPGKLTSRAGAYLGTNQSVSNAAETIVAFDTLIPGFGSTSEFDIATNKGRFTSTNGGIYNISAVVEMTNTSSLTNYYVAISKNGTDILYGTATGAIITSASNPSINATVVLAANDYIEIKGYINSAVSYPTTFIGVSSETSVQIVQIQ